MNIPTTVAQNWRFSLPKSVHLIAEAGTNERNSKWCGEEIQVVGKVLNATTRLSLLTAEIPREPLPLSTTKPEFISFVSSGSKLSATYFMPLQKKITPATAGTRFSCRKSRRGMIYQLTALRIIAKNLIARIVF